MTLGLKLPPEDTQRVRQYTLRLHMVPTEAAATVTETGGNKETDQPYNRQVVISSTLLP